MTNCKWAGGSISSVYNWLIRNFSLFFVWFTKLQDNVIPQAIGLVYWQMVLGLILFAQFGIHMTWVNTAKFDVPHILKYEHDSLYGVYAYNSRSCFWKSDGNPNSLWQKQQLWGIKIQSRMALSLKTKKHFQRGNVWFKTSSFSTSKKLSDSKSPWIQIWKSKRTDFSIMLADGAPPRKRSFSVLQ